MAGGHSSICASSMHCGLVCLGVSKQLPETLQRLHCESECEIVRLHLLLCICEFGHSIRGQ